MPDLSELIGKHLLIGITLRDEDENVLDQYQTHGKIILVDDSKGIVIEKADATGQYTLPPDIHSLHPAPPGEYRISTTGEIVVNPDFTSVWTVYATNESTLDDDYRKSGFELP